MQKRNRCQVNPQQLRIGARHEAREHNTTLQGGARIARPHICEHPNYYRMMPVFERMLARSERGRQPVRIRRCGSR